MSNNDKDSSRLRIITKGLVIKTPDEFLNRFSPPPVMHLRFLHNDMPFFQHILTVRTHVEGELPLATIPQHDSRIVIKIENATAKSPPRGKKKLKENLLNLNINGVLPDLDPLEINLINVFIEAEDIKPFTLKADAIQWIAQTSAGGEVKSIGNPTHFTRYMAADFKLDYSAQITIEISHPILAPPISYIEPKGQNVTIILDNDCLSEDWTGIGDFHYYYRALNGGDSVVTLKAHDPPPTGLGDAKVACNAVEGGNGGT